MTPFHTCVLLVYSFYILPYCYSTFILEITLKCICYDKCTKNDINLETYAKINRPYLHATCMYIQIIIPNLSIITLKSYKLKFSNDFSL